MALALKLIRVSINETATEMYLSDGTGNYSTPDNEGGWGAPNSDRVDKALLLQARLNRSEGSTEVEVQPYDPLVTNDFTLNTDTDGYYEVLYAAVDNVDPTVDDAYGWSQANGLTQYVDGNLVPKTIQDLYDDPTFLDVVSFKTVLLGRMSLYKNSVNSELSTLMIAHQDDRGHKRIISEKQEEFNRIRALLESARYNWCLDAYTIAQKIVEVFEKDVSNG